MKLSFIIPAYNAELTIGRCLDSILKEVYYIDYEIIIVNDGSTDNTEKITYEYQKKYSCIEYYCKKNEGVSSARNYGMRYAQGNYIMFLDSDDFLSKGWFENTARDICVNDTFDFVIFSKNVEKQYSEYESIEMICGIHNNISMSSVCSKFYKRNVIIDNKLKFDEEIINGEDLLFNLRYYLCSSTIKFIRLEIYNYYTNPYSATNTFNKKFIKSDISFHQKLGIILNQYRPSLEYIRNISIINAWLVFFNRYSNVSKFQYADIEAFVINGEYRNLLNQYHNYQRYFSKSKRFLLFLLNKKFYKLTYFIFKLKNKIKRCKTRIERM